MRQTESVKQYAGVFIVIALLMLAATIYRPDYFQRDLIYMMLRQAACLGILSIGQMFVVAAGGTDLSVVATMEISMVITMLFYNHIGENWLVPGILTALAVCLVLGLINGALIAYFKVAPFLTTMFTGAIFAGVRRMFTGVSPMGSIPPMLAFFVKGEQAGEVPHAALILLAVTLVGYIVLNKTVFGRKLVLVGSNPTAAEFSGIKVNKVRIITYCISAGVAVLAALIIAGYTGYVDQETLAAGKGFDSLIAVVLGGNILGGGKATVIGTLGGALATTLIFNIVVLFGFEIQHQLVFKGLILLAVILFSAFANSKSLKNVFHQKNPIASDQTNIS
jgi:ribose/xylose/arabinose/galactoside ABC-type transport system permease subunit